MIIEVFLLQGGKPKKDDLGKLSPDKTCRVSRKLWPVTSHSNPVFSV